MKTKKTRSIIVLMVLNFNFLYGQNRLEQQEQLFSSRIDNPIKIEVIDKGSEVVFYANNRSFYPYQVILDFKNTQNLSLNGWHNKYIVTPGRNNLITLSILDKNMQHYYEYSYSYTIGDPEKKAALDYPYLIPLSRFKLVELFSYNGDKKFYIKDFFKMNKEDTVFCMRKGNVTAVPDMFHEADRISINKSLEIRHNDGTVLIYENINPDRILVKLGQTVYPGEPLGIINDNLVLKVYLFAFQDWGKLNRINIHYYINPSKTSTFSDSLKNMEVKHPIEIITKEMTKREKKKFK